MKIWHLILLALCVPGALSAITVQEIDENDDGRTDQWIEMVDGTTSSIRRDRDFDGTADYQVQIDEYARKVYEELDFNFDGHMDDFYYYDRGVLVRREIDTNFDKKIDLWVHLTKGIYVSRVERDLDHDGTIDFQRDYGAVSNPSP